MIQWKAVDKEIPFGKECLFVKDGVIHTGRPMISTDSNFPKDDEGYPIWETTRGIFKQVMYSGVRWYAEINLPDEKSRMDQLADFIEKVRQLEAETGFTIDQFGDDPKEPGLYITDDFINKSYTWEEANELSGSYKARNIETFKKDMLERFGFIVLTIENIWEHAPFGDYITHYKVTIEDSEGAEKKVTIDYEEHTWNDTPGMVMWFQEKVYNHINGL